MNTENIQDKKAADNSVEMVEIGPDTIAGEGIRYNLADFLNNTHQQLIEDVAYINAQGEEGKLLMRDFVSEKTEGNYTLLNGIFDFSNFYNIPIQKIFDRIYEEYKIPDWRYRFFTRSIILSGMLDITALEILNEKE